MRRLVSLALAALGVIGIVLALPARPASAQPTHPLGNFSVNQAIGLDLYPDRVAVTAIVDLAELPTLQERPAVDTNGDGTVSAPESTAYNTRVCNAMAGAVALRVDGHRVQWSVRPAGFAYRPGSAGLHTSRVSCAFKAAADLTRPATADLLNGYRADRIGWREITAAGHGVHIVHRPVPVRSVTNSLRSYPADLLGSPLDQRSARLQVEPGDGPSAGAAIHVSGGDPVSRWVAQADRALERLVGGHLTPFVGALAVLLALMLGAAHAALPGHGKTVMAAYIAGRRGRRRDALTVGAIVTLTHTGGVLVLGLLLTATAGLAGEVVLSWLGIASGIRSLPSAWPCSPGSSAAVPRRTTTTTGTRTIMITTLGTRMSTPMTITGTRTLIHPAKWDGSAWSGWVSPAGWCRVLPLSSCCWARSVSGAPPSACCLCSHTELGWPPC